jgi:hypothetical protein
VPRGKLRLRHRPRDLRMQRRVPDGLLLPHLNDDCDEPPVPSGPLRQCNWAHDGDVLRRVRARILLRRGT